MENSPFKIACEGATTVTLDELNELHHFKGLTDADYAKCRNSMIENGFISPFSIWIDKAGIKWTVDGRQRLRTLKRWKKEDPNVPNEYPASIVFAENKEAAAKMIVALESKYGDIEKDDFTEFLTDYGLDYSEMEAWADIPDFDPEPEEKKTTAKPDKCLKCAEFHKAEHSLP